MLAVIRVFGLPVLVAGAMIDPEPISLRALITYWGLMGAITPFAAWPLFLIQIASPPAGRNQLAAVVNVWFGGTTNQTQRHAAHRAASRTFRSERPRSRARQRIDFG